MAASELSAETSFLQLPSSRQLTVKKSIDMLNEAASSSSRPMHQQMSLRHVDYTPSSVTNASRSLFDISDMAGMFTPSSILATPSLTATPGNNSTLFNSTLTTPHSQTPLQLGQTFDDVSAPVANIALLLEENPSIVACRGMFAEFAESFSSTSAQRELFQPLSRYEQICGDNVVLLQHLVSRSVPTHSSSVEVLEMLHQMRREQQTWQLVSTLYRDRLDSAAHGDVNDVVMDDTSAAYVSEKKLIDSLFESDAQLRQAQLIVDWLEHNSSDMLHNYYNKVDFSSDHMGAWENTLYMLKQQRSVGAHAAAARTIVDQLDPDAPIRQGRQLLDLDVVDDIRLLEYIFICVRAGQIEEAHRVCIKVGQMWRAATLDGWRLYHDPNHDSLGPAGSVLKVEGNRNRDVWKRACWKLSEDERLPLVERAVYAALCANLHQLLPYVHSWHDYVWAYFRALVDQKVENRIRCSFTGQRQPRPLPPSYPEEIMTAQQIFDKIQSCHDEKVLAQCSDKFCVIQKFIITASANSLIDEMFKWCKDSVARPHPHLLRFMAHLVLFFRALGITGGTEKEAMCNAVLEAFIGYLIDEKEINLVAIYVATLPDRQQIELYARLLKGVRETDQRRCCLDLGERHGLDVSRITKLVVETVGNDEAVDFMTADDMQLHASTSDEDLAKIDSLEWLTFRTAQRSEALRQANTMMRRFLGSHKLQACRLASRKIPSDSLELITKSWKSKAGDAELPAKDENAVREYLCISAYLDAHESFSDWFEHCHNARPTLPDIALGASFSERVAYEHRQRQYEQELDRWQHSLDLQTKVTVDKIYNVLLFVDGGWMVDARTDGDVDECRTHQMSLLRQLCLPSLTLLLHQVLHTAKCYKECVQIADCIADEHHQLYTVFRPEELQNLLKKIRESSVALLDAGMGPLGYELS